MLKDYFKIVGSDFVKSKICSSINIAGLINVLVIFAITVLMPLSAHAQEVKPEFLKEPAAWAFERFALPPAFAPDFPYKGIEELRFSPGMFNKDSPDYFTYAFVTQLDNITAISQNEIRDYLLDYFKGLCAGTAKDRKLVIDTSAVTIHIEKKKSTANNEVIYSAGLNIFGVFADGAPVKLNTETKALQDIKGEKIYLVFIASPQAKTDKIWIELYKIQNDFSIKNL